MKSTPIKALLIVLILFSVISQGCKKDKTLPETLPENPTLAQAKARWNASNISSYTFKLKPTCFCGNVEWHQITVVNKAITSIKNEKGQNIQFTDSNLRTVDGLFKYLQSSLAENPDQATIKYDQTYGFPTYINIDFKTRWADDEMRYDISDFVRK
ncbi:MAG TPA: DUF6174 domain-containing protein [Pedobacter sp.]|jgi:hypothetical protein